jgi:hypothetical protein
VLPSLWVLTQIAQYDTLHVVLITLTIESATLDGDTLSVKFSAAKTPDVEGVDAADIVPTVLVGLYGWDTKDFIVGAHERLIDDNGDGAINGDDSRTLEFEVGAEHPRIKIVTAEGGSWEVTADLSPWKDLIADGTAKRVEVGVLPVLVVDEQELAIDAATKTFDLAANAFDDELIKEIGAGGFAMLKEHMDMGGYFIEAGQKPAETLQSVFDEIMPLFK